MNRDVADWDARSHEHRLAAEDLVVPMGAPHAFIDEVPEANRRPQVACRRASPYPYRMNSLRACVKNGRLVLDEPTTSPDGTVIELVADDEGDDLTSEERRALHEALSASWTSADAGQLRPASAILDELRRRR